MIQIRFPTLFAYPEPMSSNQFRQLLFVYVVLKSFFNIIIMYLSALEWGQGRSAVIIACSNSRSFF
jgi:hypothetical protein